MLWDFPSMNGVLSKLYNNRYLALFIPRIRPVVHREGNRHLLGTIVLFPEFELLGFPKTSLSSHRCGPHISRGGLKGLRNSRVTAGKIYFWLQNIQGQKFKFLNLKVVTVLFIKLNLKQFAPTGKFKHCRYNFKLIF